MSQVIANDRVNVIEPDGRILIHHFFRGGTFLICGDKRVECHASACNAVNAICIGSERNWFSFNDE